MNTSFLDDLAARRRFGMKPGLDTIRSLCSALGNPERGIRAIRVAGTNGKGAVCAILDSCLRAAGFSVGRYTSPHLVKLNERFFLDGAPVSDDKLEYFANLVKNQVDGLVGSGVSGTPFNPNTQTTPNPNTCRGLSPVFFQPKHPNTQTPKHPPFEPTFFEALTAVAFLLYDDAKPDYTILETGLGGRLDATNVCHPCLTIITRIGLDHCDWLGDTVEKIAVEKAGIIKPGVPVVLGRNVPEVISVVKARAQELNAPFYYAPEMADESQIPEDFSLVGSFNRENAVTALAALKLLPLGTVPSRTQTLKHSNTPTLLSGFARVTWPGRFQRIGRFIVDGAHNPPAARALAAALADAGTVPTMIAGFCGDKDVEETLRILRPHVSRAIAVRTNNPRSLDPETLAEKMRKVGIEAFSCDSLQKAIASLGSDPKIPGSDPKIPGTVPSKTPQIVGTVPTKTQTPKHPNTPPPVGTVPSGDVLICGSLFLAGEALVELGAYPWGEARFDPAEKLR